MSTTLEALKTSSPTVFKHLIDTGFIRIADITDDELANMNSEKVTLLLPYVSNDRWNNIIMRVGSDVCINIMKHPNFEFIGDYISFLKHIIIKGRNKSFEAALDKIKTLTRNDMIQLIDAQITGRDGDVLNLMANHPVFEWDEELHQRMKCRYNAQGYSLPSCGIDVRLAAEKPLREARAIIVSRDATIAERDAEIAVLKKQLADISHMPVSNVVIPLQDRVALLERQPSTSCEYLLSLGLIKPNEITCDELRKINPYLISRCESMISTEVWQELAKTGGSDVLLQFVLKYVTLAEPFKTLTLFNYGQSTSLKEFLDKYPVDSHQTTKILLISGPNHWDTITEIILKHPNTQPVYDVEIAQALEHSKELTKLYAQRTGQKPPISELESARNENARLAKELADLRAAIAKCT